MRQHVVRKGTLRILKVMSSYIMVTNNLSGKAYSSTVPFLDVLHNKL